MESKIGLGHTLFEQHMSLPSLTFISSYIKCYIVMLISYIMVLLYHHIVTID